MMLITPWKLLASQFRIKTMNNSFPCPRNIEKIIQVNIDRSRAHVFDEHYEFLDAGPLDIGSCNCAWAHDIVQIAGLHPTFYDIPPRDEDDVRPWKLLAFSTDQNDATLTLTVRGTTTLFDDVVTGGVPGEKVAINQWRGGIQGELETLSTYTQSPSTYTSITGITKPVTRGYVSLYAYDETSTTTNVLWFLGKYHPDETQPGYRRYKVLGHDFTNGECINCLAQIAYVPLKHDTDLLPVQNMDALGAMMKAINHYDADEPTDGAVFEGQALNLLSKQLKRDQPMMPIVRIQSDAAGIQFDHVQ
jgi:hypothetical protein